MLRIQRGKSPLAASRLLAQSAIPVTWRDVTWRMGLAQPPSPKKIPQTNGPLFLLVHWWTDWLTDCLVLGRRAGREHATQTPPEAMAQPVANEQSSASPSEVKGAHRALLKGGLLAVVQTGSPIPLTAFLVNMSVCVFCLFSYYSFLLIFYNLFPLCSYSCSDPCIHQ